MRILCTAALIWLFVFPVHATNIVVVMVDDLSVTEDAALTLNNWQPNIDALRSQAVQFENAFVTDPICCPSRASFLTGQYPHNHGVLTNNLPLGGVSKLVETDTIAVALQPTYRTIYVGKYLNRYGADTLRTHVPQGWDDWHALLDPTTYRVYDYDINHNGTIQAYGSTEAEYQTDVLKDIALAAIPGTEPFFLMVNTLAPHMETTGPGACVIRGNMFASIRPAPRHANLAANEPLPMGPSFNEADVTDKPSPISGKPLFSQSDIDCMSLIYRNKLESMMAVDDLVGALVAALPEDTVMIYVSDNGFMFGEHRLWRKSWVYEYSIRIPLFVKGPWISRTTQALVTMNDLAPTIAEIARILFDGDGTSLVPLLTLEQPWRKRFLIENEAPVKYLVYREDDLLYGAYTATLEFEHYDLAADPDQLTNLGVAVPAMTQQLLRLRQCAFQECRNEEFAPLMGVGR